MNFSSKLVFYSQLIAYSLVIILTLLVSENIFFWDTVQLASRHAHYYFENNFNTLLLPENIDSGHPPTFGIYLAILWKIFGKSLLVSHVSMLPFLLGIVFYLKKIGEHFFSSDIFVVVFIWLCILDPCLAGQAILVSPDIVISLFFLMSIHGILAKNKWILGVGLVGLCLVSTRGYMIAAALFVFDFVNYFVLEKNKPSAPILIKKAAAYFPGAMISVGFLFYHYQQTGWIGYHENSPWAPAFQKVDGMGFIKNIGILGWRMLDFGRIFLWIIILGIGQKIIFQKIKIDLKTKQLLLLFLSLMVFLTPSFLLHQMLSGHRYILPLLLVINLSTIYFIYFFIKNKKWQLRLLLIGFLGLASGNLWVYQPKIAQGWDSTLAHLPYYELRESMMIYIKDNNIPLSTIGSAFPNLAPLKYLELNDDLAHFAEKELDTQSYIFYSNVFNDFTDAEIDALQNNWIVLKKFQKNNICVILYQKPDKK